MISFYYRAKTKVRVGSGLSKEFWMLVSVYEESAWSALLFESLVDVIMKYAVEGLIYLYAGDLVLINESKENLRKKFLTWKKVFKRKEVMVSLKKTKVIVNS